MFASVVLLLSMQASTAKTTTGEFQLTPENHRNIIGSFAVFPGSKGIVDLTMTTRDKPYGDSRGVRLRMFMDERYSKYMAAETCYEKISFTSLSEKVKFVPNTMNGPDDEHVYTFGMSMDSRKLTRPHYYYFVVDDCSLEIGPDDVAIEAGETETPVIHFTLEAKNDESHLSADEFHLKSMHTVALLVSASVAVLMALLILQQALAKNSVHAAMFCVMAAASIDAASRAVELMNLSIYSNGGIRSSFLEEISSVLGGTSDSIAAVLLLSIAAGWTMPTDTFQLGMPTTMNDAYSSPYNKAGAKNGAVRILTSTHVMALAIFVPHVLLSLLGCKFSHEIDSYHDFEHWPGKILMIIRVLLGICLVAACLQTRMKCARIMQPFYLRLALVGSVWFQSMPFVTFFCTNFVPFHLRHWAVGTWCSFMQCLSIILLAFLVTSQNVNLQHYTSGLSRMILSSSSSSIPMSFRSSRMADGVPGSASMHSSMSSSSSSTLSSSSSSLQLPSGYSTGSCMAAPAYSDSMWNMAASKDRMA